VIGPLLFPIPYLELNFDSKGSKMLQPIEENTSTNLDAQDWRWLGFFERLRCNGLTLLEGSLTHSQEAASFLFL